MSLLEKIDKNNVPKHVAIIMDGNGRWAKKQGMMRVFGHKNGVKAVRASLEAAVKSGVENLIQGAYRLLNYITYFTVGVKEVRAWTIHIGDTAPQAAGVIHTDFERGFIRAQTIAYEDFVQLKGEQGAKEAGKMRAEGKEYIVKDGDVLNFLFNV